MRFSKSNKLLLTENWIKEYLTKLNTDLSWIAWGRKLSLKLNLLSWKSKQVWFIRKTLPQINQAFANFEFTLVNKFVANSTLLIPWFLPPWTTRLVVMTIRAIALFRQMFLITTNFYPFSTAFNSSLPVCWVSASLINFDCKLWYWTLGASLV